jgi:hypothetical protein
MKKPHLTIPETNASSMWERLEAFARAYVQVLQGAELLPAVYAGAQRVDGVLRTRRSHQQMAA